MPLADLLGAIAPQPDAMPSMAPIYQALAQNALKAQPQAAPVAHQPSKLRNFIGMLGDALYTSAGGRGTPMYQRMQQQSAVQQYLGSAYPELAGMVGAGVDVGDAASLYKALHPASETPDTAKIYEYRQKLDPAARADFDKVMATLHPGMMAPYVMPEQGGHIEVPGSSSSLPQVSDQAGYDALPAGAQFITRDGYIRVKGGQSGATPAATFPGR